MRKPRSLQYALMVCSFITGGALFFGVRKMIDWRVRLLPLTITWIIEVSQAGNIYAQMSAWCNMVLAPIPIMTPLIIQEWIILGTIICILGAPFITIFGAALVWMFIRKRILAIIPELRT